ncbi:MAG TPA: hypothetical protein VFA33_16615 [Bryobacteraceae bacterium]|nr:hypothetical protein [Bryobacteraceae bacterium]
MPRKKKPFVLGKEVRKLARERVGTVPAAFPIEPKTGRKKTKHKKPLSAENDESV